MEKIFGLQVTKQVNGQTKEIECEAFSREQQELEHLFQATYSDKEYQSYYFIKALKVDQMTGDEVEDLIRSQKSFRAYTKLPEDQKLGMDIPELPADYLAALEVGGVYITTSITEVGEVSFSPRVLLVGMNPLGEKYGLEVFYSDSFIDQHCDRQEFVQAFSL